MSIFNQFFNWGCRAEGVKLNASGSAFTSAINGSIAVSTEDPKILADGSTLLEMIVRNCSFAFGGLPVGVPVMSLDGDRQEQAPASSYRMNPGGEGGRHELNMYLRFEAAGLFPGKVLQSKGIVRLSADVSTFPADKQTYQLDGVMEFEDPMNPGPVLAKIETFPALLTCGS